MSCALGLPLPPTASPDTDRSRPLFRTACCDREGHGPGPRCAPPAKRGGRLREISVTPAVTGAWEDRRVARRSRCVCARRGLASLLACAVVFAGCASAPAGREGTALSIDAPRERQCDESATWKCRDRDRLRLLPHAALLRSEAGYPFVPAKETQAAEAANGVKPRMISTAFADSRVGRPLAGRMNAPAALPPGPGRDLIA
jgi:hypothetical protein